MDHGPDGGSPSTGAAPAAPGHRVRKTRTRPRGSPRVHRKRRQVPLGCATQASPRVLDNRIEAGKSRSSAPCRARESDKLRHSHHT